MYWQGRGSKRVVGVGVRVERVGEQRGCIGHKTVVGSFILS
jgi:hypothetical protein